jgi:hypothetical protein
MADPYRPRRRVLISGGPTPTTARPPRNLEQTERLTPQPRCAFCGGAHSNVEHPVDEPAVEERTVESTVAEMESMPTIAVDLVDWINTPDRAHAARVSESQREKPRKTVMEKIEKVLGG